MRFTSRYCCLRPVDSDRSCARSITQSQTVDLTPDEREVSRLLAKLGASRADLLPSDASKTFTLLIRAVDLRISWLLAPTRGGCQLEASNLALYVSSFSSQVHARAQAGTHRPVTFLPI